MEFSSSEFFWVVKPKPAFCAKLRRKTENGSDEKIFLNFCTCEELPPPVEDIDEDGLATILESSDPGSYRIPISVGEAHAEEDKSGHSCKAYDIILNERFYTKRVDDSELFRTFLILVAIDAVESKHNLRNIDRQNWLVLKNRKSVGHLQEQRIRKQPRPLIEVLDGGSDEDSSKSSVSGISRTQKSALASGLQTPGNSKPASAILSTKKRVLLEPRYEIRRDRATSPTKITAVFRLDGVKSTSEIELDIGEHRIRVVAPKVKYSEDVFVSLALNENAAKAKFLVDEGKLVIEIPMAL